MWSDIKNMHTHTKKDFCIHFLFNIPFILNPLLYLCCGWTRSRKGKKGLSLLFWQFFFRWQYSWKKRTPVVSEGGKWNCTSAYIKKHIVFLVYSPILHLHQKKLQEREQKKQCIFFWCWWPLKLKKNLWIFIQVCCM